MSFVQGETFVEATLETSEGASADASTGDKRINKVYGARGSYIANTLLTDSEYINYVLVWAVVFTILIIGARRIMQTALEQKQVRDKLDQAFDVPVETYAQMPNPKSNSEL